VKHFPLYHFKTNVKSIIYWYTYCGFQVTTSSFFVRRVYQSSWDVEILLILLYPIHVGLNVSGANRTHLALTFI
jgi:hypothetical protein